MRTKILQHVLSSLVILTLFSIFILPIIAAQTPVTDVRVHLTGPSTLGTLRSGSYSTTFDDPLARTWTYKLYITADNTSGASPLKDSPINGTISPENKTFTFDITAQQKIGDLEIHINCTSGAYYYEKVQKIHVVNPISLKAKINNPTNIEVANATVQFYVDGTEIDKQVIQTIGANQSVDVESEWISLNKEPGWHDSRIVVDLNGDGLIETQSGDMIIDSQFYIQGESNWVMIITIIVGLMALIVGFGYISKRKM